MDDRALNSIVERLSRTTLRKLDKEEFDNFIFQAYINGKAAVLAQILTSKKKKNRYIRNLDKCYSNAKAENCNALEQMFLQKVPFASLPDLIEIEAQKYSVNISISSFSSYRAKVLNDLKSMFQNGDLAAFEQFAIEKLPNQKGFFSYKAEFINLLVDDPKYAYCWTKFINLKRKVPKFVRKTKNIYLKDAEAFIRRMNGDQSAVIETYEIENYQVFGKQYKVIIVTNEYALQQFAEKYLIESKPEILGIDIESIPIVNKIALIQLATKDWCCIIDPLSEHAISDFNFNHLFQHIFDPSIIRVGFAWASDYYLIGNTFSFLKPLMQNEKHKSFCLKKFVESILKNAEAEKAVFPNEKLTSVSLNKVSKAILGSELDKEMQRSDWTQRPLTTQQKLYAIMDAIVVLLIKEKIENALKKNLNATTASKIIEQGYVCMKQDKETINELTKNLKNVSI